MFSKMLLTFAVGVNALVCAEDNFYEQYRDSAISSAAGTPWNAERHLQLVQRARILRENPHIELATLTDKMDHGERIPFFAYSSMIDKEAGAVKAISPEGAATQTPAIAFGIQRTFNREMSAATVEKGWGPLKDPKDLGILNVFNKEDGVVNGVLFELPLSDLQILSKREVGYTLIPIVATRWQEALDQNEPEMIFAYTFQAPDYQGEGERYTHPDINPIPGYFDFLQKGLHNFGADFTAMWWATTYLADQKTLVSELPYRN